MPGGLPQIFSHHFPGTVWNTLAVESHGLLFVEVRNDVTFQVTFSAFDYITNTFYWKDRLLHEAWWISLTAANASTVLLTRYLAQGNPDQKSLLALDGSTGSTRWEVEHFSFVTWTDTEVFGYILEEDELRPARIHVASGTLVTGAWPTHTEQPAEMVRPVFYAAGTAHFETIKKFVSRADYSAVKGVEYLELEKWIVVSLYVPDADKLANYLLVFSREGKLELQVKLGEKLAGLGVDTFFILSGCLFLVQNKTDLVAYRL